MPGPAMWDLKPKPCWNGDVASACWGIFRLRTDCTSRLWQKPGEKDLRTRMRIVLEQANNAWFQGRYQEAFDLRQEVEKNAVNAGWSLERVMAKNSGGLIWWTLGDNKRALLELREALGLGGTALRCVVTKWRRP